MRITRIGSDYISINEDNLYDKNLLSIPRVHLIKLNFWNPTRKKIEKVLELYPRTNRFIIDNNIRIYNNILKRTSKKFYVSNTENSDIISFFRKNNKVLVDFTKLNVFEKQFLLLNGVFEDLLKNTEVIYIEKDVFKTKKDDLKKWNGNVILHDEDYII